MRSPPKRGDELNTGVNTVGTSSERVQNPCFFGFGIGLFTQCKLREQLHERIGVNAVREH